MKPVWLAPMALIMACACATSPDAPKPAAVAMAKPAVAAALAKPVADPNKVVCKTDTPIGHHTPVETCHTKQEWADIRKRQAEGVSDAARTMQGSANIGSANNISAPPQ